MNNSTQQTDSLELNELKQHRKKLDLSVQAVADGMKVSKDFINHIESGDFEKLGAPTFVRGHITNYCKVLGIQPAAILQQVPKDLLQHQQLQTSDASGSSPLSHVRRQSNHFGRYAIGTALLGMLCMSFYFIWDKWSLSGEQAFNSDLTIGENNNNTDTDKKITYSSLIPQVVGPQQNQTSDQVDNSNNEISTDSPVTVDDELPNEQIEDAISDDASTTDSSADELQVNPSSVATEADTSDLNTDSPLYSIVMQFEEQAWVSIKTLDGENIVQDLLGPGLREFQVSEPVHFRIGNAQKLQLTINDDVIELAPLTEQDIADFAWPLSPNS